MGNYSILGLINCGDEQMEELSQLVNNMAEELGVERFEFNYHKHCFPVNPESVNKPLLSLSNNEIVDEYFE